MTEGPRLHAHPIAALLAAMLCCAGVPASASDAPDTAEMPALRWAEGVYRWHYSRLLEPEWLPPGLGRELFLAAAHAWAGCGVRIEFAGETELPAGRLDGMNVAGWSDSLQRGMRGITLKRRAGSALVEADVVVSATNPQLRASPQLLRKVVVHEFGHALGLVHSPDCADVMSFGASCRHLSAQELPQRPAAGDLAQCTARYRGAQGESERDRRNGTTK